ncbi:MAG: DNA-protecting protein DprA [Actinobacteria bacterium]|nr:MAG: DNA-protecting protein DprA [Actinomycetota bacterium]
MTVIVLERGNSRFPPLLAQLHDPPARLYVRGGPPEVLSRPAVAVVGARSCSAYGAQVARTLGRELGGAGAVVVSGLARGVDSEAHRGALDAGGVTVAVLGCGIDRDYPRAHADLAARIAASGAIVSEYPPGVEPAPWRFPARNRIVAGLALAVVVVEARARSGALITADFSLELGRDVFAVPGEITAVLSRGTNHLLRLGAAPLLSAADVLAAIGLEAPASVVPRLTAEDEAVLGTLADEARGADELARALGRTSGEIAAVLVRLELEGLVAEADGVYRALNLGTSPDAHAPA